MSALGQKRNMAAVFSAMSALPLKADILFGERNDSEHDFSHPISHRTLRYGVGNRGTRRFVNGEKCLGFPDKTELHDTGQHGLQRFRKPMVAARRDQRASNIQLAPPALCGPAGARNVSADTTRTQYFMRVCVRS